MLSYTARVKVDNLALFLSAVLLMRTYFLAVGAMYMFKNVYKCPLKTHFVHDFEKPAMVDIVKDFFCI